MPKAPATGRGFSVKGDAAVFVDRAQIRVKAGDGGAGAVSFRREKFVPNGGPNGGDGGRGGSVRLEVDTGMRTLMDLRYRREFSAEPGRPGEGSHRRGKDGQSVQIRVPPGTLVFDAASGALLSDLRVPGQVYVCARGGRGGRGNARFASAVHQAPRMAERGEPGAQRELRLELKLLADVGLIGFPNAGKSTLITRFTAAHPRVAAYPFTTLNPELGVLRDPEGNEVVFADIPGLIEGAHQGVGLGDRFLRHVERCALLVFVLDAAGTEDRDPIDDLGVLRRELQAYSPELERRAWLCVLNKQDLPAARANRARQLAEIAALGASAFPLSAATGEGIDEFLLAVTERVRRAEPPAIPEVEAVFNPRPRASFEIHREAAVMRLEGVELERRVRMTDPASEEALSRLNRYLERRGIARALTRAGARPGQRIVIADTSFLWVEDLERREGCALIPSYSPSAVR